MLTDMLLAILLVPALALGWVAVQGAWRKSFTASPDADVLAGRNDCGNCGCAEQRCNTSNLHHGDQKHEAR